MIYKEVSVSFVVQYERKGIAKFMEKLGWLKEKKEGFQFIIRKDDSVNLLSAGDSDFCSLKHIYAKGLRES